MRGAIAANQLRGWLIPIADARKRRDAHGRADETGPGRGCMAATSRRAPTAAHSVGVRMYIVPESQAMRSLRIRVGGSPGRAVLAVLTQHMQLYTSSAVAAAHWH